tara:strand:- start:1091 stop:1327 length:237 start_codon:yes stop_codon:yes gene_type:complete
MSIKGVVSRVATIGGSLSNTTNLRAKQVTVGSSSVDLGAKSIQELSDVQASETDKGLLQYNQSNDKWETTTVIDGGTF